MRLKMNGSTAVVVRKSWVNLQAIQLFLRNRPVDKIQSPDDSHTLFVRVLDDTDERGLWIELNTKEHENNHAVELQALMIPWHAVLAVVIANDFRPAMKEAQKLKLQLECDRAVAK